MNWVVDCSFVASLVLPDESSSKAEDFCRQRSATATLWVPALFWYELGNVLVQAQRRNRLTPVAAQSARQAIQTLALCTDERFAAALVEQQIALAIRYDLSAYDAVYLELAEAKKAGLASADAALLEAASRHGLMAS